MIDAESESSQTEEWVEKVNQLLPPGWIIAREGDLRTAEWVHFSSFDGCGECGHVCPSCEGYDDHVKCILYGMVLSCVPLCLECGRPEWDVGHFNPESIGHEFKPESDAVWHKRRGREMAKLAAGEPTRRSQ